MPPTTGNNLTAGRTPGEAARTLIATSLAVTAACAVVAAGASAVTETRFLLAFVLLRWSVVFVLLATPLLHQVLRRWTSVQLPYVMRTPLTALLLTCESIVVDIISAQLH